MHICMGTPSRTLTHVRTQIILKLYYAIVGLASIMVVLRFVQGQMSHLIANCVVLLAGGLSLYLFNKKPQILLGFSTAILLGVTLFLSQKESVVSSVIYLSMFPALATLLFDRKWKRYLLCALSIIVFTYVFRNELYESYIYYFLVIVGFFVALIFSEYLESQQNELFGILESKEKLAKQLEVKNKELVTFAHIMSHDLKTPLRSIQSFSKLIRKQNEFENDKTEEYFQYIEGSSLSMSVLINDLLLYYQTEKELELNDKVDLNNVLENIKSNYQFDLSRGALILEVDELPIVNGDSNLMKTVFQNLISNSIKFQPKLNEDHVPSVVIKSESRENHNYITVKDNGIGIDKDYVPDVFNSFIRYHKKTDYQGSGLGMSICKRVMLKHGGEIELVETSSQGTTFGLRFPKSL